MLYSLLTLSLEHVLWILLDSCGNLLLHLTLLEVAFNLLLYTALQLDFLPVVLCEIALLLCRALTLGLLLPAPATVIGQRL